MDFILWSLLLIFNVDCSPKLHLITVINDDNPAYGFRAAVPMYEAAFENANSTYVGLFDDTIRSGLYQPELVSCPQAGAFMLSVAAKVFDLIQRYPDHWPVVFTPGCSPEAISIGDFAREWNIPLIAGVASDQSLRDKIRFPTVVTFAGTDNQNLARAVRRFLEQHHWRTLTFLCDAASQYTAVSTFYALSCSNTRRTLEADLGRYTIYQHSFDSKTFVDFANILTQMKQQSRVAVIFTHPLILRKILVASYQLGMSGGDYVFISSQCTRVPTMGDVTWRLNDDDDEVAFRAFQCLVLVSNPNPDWDRLTNLLDQYGHISVLRFGKNFSDDEKRNELAVGMFESFMAFSSVLNKWRSEIRIMTGRQFSSQFFNRSFSFPSRDIYIGPTGMRINDAVFSWLNVTSGVMELTWRYFTSTGELKSVSDLAPQWPGPDGPPPDKPACGYRNDLCAKNTTEAGIVAGCVTALVAILAASMLAALRWRQRQNDDADTVWWALDASRLLHVDFTSPKLSSIIRTERIVCPLNASKIRSYDLGQKLVWLEGISSSLPEPKAVLHSKAACHTLKVVKSLNHENVSPFVGIVHVTSRYICTVFEYGLRGSLRCLLQSEQIPVDASLQSSLVRETISGLAYIHASQLRSHGQLSSLCIMVDRRLCIKIAGYATIKFRRALRSPPFCEASLELAILWIPPEACDDTNYIGSREGDVFSLGIVICEIVSKATPLGTKLASSQSIKESVHYVRKRPSEPRIEASVIPSDFRTTIWSCFNPAPAKRPTLSELAASLSWFLPRGRLIDNLMLRLGRYADELERVVVQRTQELIREQARVDELLTEILPLPLVTALRNQCFVPAELFADATILFSDIPMFGSVCAVCTPGQIFALLNDLYVAWDGALSRFDVYKVETIIDSHVVASGLPVRNAHRHAGEIARMALCMLDATSDLGFPANGLQKLQLRMGANTGSCAAGMVGVKLPRYCIFGDTMNTASRMQSYGIAGEIHISKTTKLRLDTLGEFFTLPRGHIEIKGKGEMETFWLKKRRRHGTLSVRTSTEGC